MRIAYLGPAGTYSEEAAHIFRADSQLLPCGSFEEIITATEQGEADAGILPIENSTEGSIAHTLDLMLNTELHIIAELMLPIHHQLLANATNLAEVTVVAAHPQALGQCRQWLNLHLPQAIRTASSSNGEAAQIAAAATATAAIASRTAGELYHLNVLAKDIEDEHSNTTRFVVLQSAAAPRAESNKTSLVIGTQNIPGALHHVLGIFATHGIDMTRIESRPIAAKPWEYLFYIDVKGHQADAAMTAALQELQAVTTYLKVLGSYPLAN